MIVGYTQICMLSSSHQFFSIFISFRFMWCRYSLGIRKGEKKREAFLWPTRSIHKHKSEKMRKGALAHGERGLYGGELWKLSKFPHACQYALAYFSMLTFLACMLIFFRILFSNFLLKPPSTTKPLKIRHCYWISFIQHIQTHVLGRFYGFKHFPIASLTRILKSYFIDVSNLLHMNEVQRQSQRLFYNERYYKCVSVNIAFIHNAKYK